MMTRLICTNMIWAMALLVSSAITGQTARFEVAAIKPSRGDISFSSGLTTSKGRLTATNVTLKRCIMGAFGVGPNQIAGGPEWLESDRYDITAKAELPTVSDAELMEMMQTLMADRFKLAIRRDKRTIQAYVLELAKKGPKLNKSTAEQASTHSGRGSIDARSMTMIRLAEVLSRQMDLPVVNETGLEGSYDLKLEWNPDPGRPTKIDSEPSIFTALQEQLGLRLTSRKTPVEVIVIDHAERPSEN